MTPAVVISAHAQLKLQTLDAPEAQRVRDALARIADDPSTPALKRMNGRANVFLYPVGRLKVVVELSPEQVIMITAYQDDELRALAS